MRDEKAPIESPQNNDEEIDLLELASKLWKSRRTIFIFAIAGAVIGLIVAFSIPKEYTTTIKLASEGNGNSSGKGLGALAAIAGIGGGQNNGGDAVMPALYPEVVSSVPFVVGLFDVPVKELESDTTCTVREYMGTRISSPWWSTVISLPRKAVSAIASIFRDSATENAGETKTDPFSLTIEEAGIKGAISSRIICTYDQQTGVNTISVTTQDPLVSAMMADTVAAHLQAFITDYRTSKARKDLEYVGQLNDEARTNYYTAQQKLADYLDRNQGITLHSAQVTRDRLTNEAQLAFSLFNQTSQQLQVAKAKVQETTPVYATVEPATVPLRPSKPSKPLIIIGFILVAVIAASVKILSAGYLDSIKSQLSDK